MAMIAPGAFRHADRVHGRDAVVAGGDHGDRFFDRRTVAGFAESDRAGLSTHRVGDGGCQILSSFLIQSDQSRISIDHR